MTKLEINLNQQSQLLEKMRTAKTDAEDEALSHEMLALRERELDLREDEAMNGADDEAELEMYDDAPAFSLYEE